MICRASRFLSRGFFLCLFLLGGLVFFSARTHLFAFDRVEKTLLPQGPLVAVSIPPLYMLARDVMEGVGTPHLIISSLSSPHDFVLKPSDVKKLSGVQVLFWMGKDLEHGLFPFITKIGRTTRVVSFEESPSLARLKNKDIHGHGIFDPHVWLNPENAIKIAKQIRDELCSLDPDHKNLYRQNTQALIFEIRESSWRLLNLFKDFKKTDIVVFHNAYQYFLTYFNLGHVHPLTFSPEAGISLHRLKEIEKMLATSKGKCLFVESQFHSLSVENMAKRLQIEAKKLDSLGSPHLSYAQFLESMGKSFISCLEKKRP